MVDPLANLKADFESLKADFERWLGSQSQLVKVTTDQLARNLKANFESQKADFKSHLESLEKYKLPPSRGVPRADSKKKADESSSLLIRFLFSCARKY